MSDCVVDSSVVAKWVLPEADSAQAQRLLTDAASTGDRLIVLDLAFPEVANAIWKHHHRGLVTTEEARRLLDTLLRAPVQVEPAARLIPAAFEIATRYDRAVYDALFCRTCAEQGAAGHNGRRATPECRSHGLPAGRLAARPVTAAARRRVH